MKDNFGCPVQGTANVIAGKWKVLIVWHLSFGSRRFAHIRDLLPGVSEKVLTAQLKELQKDGVIRRRAAKTVPPEVSHELTDAGNELVTVMETMCAWGIKRLGIQPRWPRSATSGVQQPEQAVG